MSPEVWEHADKLMCVELLTPDGNWSSYPPHRHDDSPECPVNNEEIYYFRIGRAGTRRVLDRRVRDAPHLHARRIDRRERGGRRRRRVPGATRVPRPVHRRPRLHDVLPQRARRTRRRPVDGVLRRPDPSLGPRLVDGDGDRSAGADDQPRGSPDTDDVGEARRHRGDRLRVDGPGAQPRLPAGAELLPRSQLRARVGGRQRHRRGPARRGGAIVRVRDGGRVLAQRGRTRRRRRRVRDRSEHAPRRDGRSGSGQRQARVLREARRRHAGADRRRRAGGAAGRRDLGCRLQLPLGAARAVRQATRRQRCDRRHHELLRAVLLDVRVGSARPAVVAVPRRPGGPRRVDRHPQPLRRPRPLPDRHRRRSDHPRRRDR